MSNVFFIFEYSSLRGGAPQTDIALIRGFVARGWSVVVLVRENTEAERVLRTISGIVVIPTSGLFISIRHPFKTFKSVFLLWKELKAYSRTHWVLTDGSIGRVLMSFLFWMKPQECFISRGGDYRTHTGYFIRLFFPFIKRIVAISPSQKKKLLDAGACDEQIRVIFNGLKLPEKKLGHKNSEIVRISTLGFVSKLKNQEIGVRLVDVLRSRGVHAVFYIYGKEIEEGEDAEYAHRLRQLIKTLDLEKYVTFKGFSDDIDGIFLETDILISSSWSEGFGRSIVEAMLRRCPVVAYAGAGGPKDIISHEKTGFLVFNNVVEEYAKCVLALIHNPKMQKRIVDSAYSDAYVRFSEDAMISSFCNLLK